MGLLETLFIKPFGFCYTFCWVLLVCNRFLLGRSTQSNPPVSASSALSLQICTTTFLSAFFFFFVLAMLVFHFSQQVTFCFLPKNVSIDTVLLPALSGTVKMQFEFFSLQVPSHHETRECFKSILRWVSVFNLKIWENEFNTSSWVKCTGDWLNVICDRESICKIWGHGLDRKKLPESCGF